MRIRHFLSFVGYCLLTIAINILAIKTQSQIVTIFFWILFTLFFINLFRSISWGVHFYFSNEKQWLGNILCYFLNSFIPKELLHEMRNTLKKDNEGKVLIVILSISLVSYFIKQKTDWLSFSFIFWITFMFPLLYLITIYYEAGEKELYDKRYDEPLGFIKLFGFALSFWLFITGVVEFKTIQSDTMPQYTELIFNKSKKYIQNVFRPSTYHSEDYDDDAVEPYIHSHTGKE